MQHILLYLKLTLIAVLVFTFHPEARAQRLILTRADLDFDKLEYAKAVEGYETLAQKGYEKVDKEHVDSRIAECYYWMRKYQKSLAWFEKSVYAKGCRPEMWLYYAQALRSVGKYKEADIWLDEYDEAVPDNSFVARLKAADINEFMKTTCNFVIDSLDINSQFSDFSPAFFGEGIVFVSSRDTSSMKRYGWTDEPYYSLFFSEKDSLEAFASPEKFFNLIDTRYHEGPLVFSPDMKTVYFTRNNAQRWRRGLSSDKANLLKIYTAQYVDSLWLDVRELSFNSREYSCAHPTLSPEGNVMVFASNMPGGFGGTDLYLTRKTESGWSKPMNLGETVNTELNELFPSIADDNTLYFASDGHAGLGGLDVFLAKPRFDSIVTVRNIGMPINSSLDDFGLIFREGKGYFSTNRFPDKGDDIYFVIPNTPPTALNDTFYIEVFRDSTVVADFDITNNDYDKESGLKDLELFNQVAIGNIELKDGNIRYTTDKGDGGIDSFSYKVYDHQGLSAEAQVYIHRKGENPPLALPDSIIMIWGEKEMASIDVCHNDSDSDGDLDPSTVKILQEPLSAKKLELDGSMMHFVPTSQHMGRDSFQYVVYDKKGNSDTATVFIDIRAEVMDVPLSEGMELSLSLLYDLNKADIRPDAAKILDSLAFYLNKYPGMEVELGSHCDCRGGTKFNWWLSMRRAKSAVKYLSTKGINRKRLTYKGYGESRPLNHCVDGVSCSEEEYQINRRTTVKVTKLNGIDYKSRSKF